MRQQTAAVAQDLGIPGSNNGRYFITLLHVAAERVCTVQPFNPFDNPLGNKPTDGALFLDGSRAFNGIGQALPPMSGGGNVIEQNRLGTDDTEDDVTSSDSNSSGGNYVLTVDPSITLNPTNLLENGNDVADMTWLPKLELVGDNTIGVKSIISSQSNVTLDLGATAYSSNDKLDFTQYGKNVYLGATKSADGKGQAVGLYTDENMTAFTGLSFSGMTNLNLGGGDNKIDISTDADPYLHTINMGGGNNVISTGNINLTINLGDGNDTVKSTGASTTVKAGKGVDTIEASHNGKLLIEDANANVNDRITYYGATLTGGVRRGGSESVYAYGVNGEAYGRNAQGDLVIIDANGNETFIPGFNFGTDGTNRTAGIEVLQITFKLVRTDQWTAAFQTAASIICATGKAGEALFGWKPSGVKDPLVLDLTGGGISLSAQESSGVSFDINNDGFAAGVGWTDSSGGNGFLVRDLNGNGKIDNDSEMFGGPSSSGFAQHGEKSAGGATRWCGASLARATSTRSTASIAVLPIGPNACV